ncbi:MAG: LamG domain-containing protein, partial [Chloroflexota bacterium]|nr:LamG domain-containing protein [Chloroflexota bacterium]
MTGRERLIQRAAIVTLLAAMLLQPSTRVNAASGVTTFHLDGASTRYADRGVGGSLSGSPQIGVRGRAFGARLPMSVSAKSVARLGGFPYGVYGMNEKDSGTPMNYSDPGDVDPLVIGDELKREGVYNIAVATQLGSPSNEAKLCRTLGGLKARNIKLILRAIHFKSDYTLDVAKSEQWLVWYKELFAKHCNYQDVVYAWYSYDEPAQKQPGVTLTELRKAYSLYKKHFPSTPVFTVYNNNNNPALGDANRDGITDGFFGQPKNPYGSGVADIVGLDAYVAVNGGADPVYTYHAIDLYYKVTRRAVNKVNPNTPIWAIAQAHALATAPSNVPEPHQMYRQVNDWLRAGPDNGLRGIDGFIWYSWKFAGDPRDPSGDLGSQPRNRTMARAIGAQLKQGTVIAHRKPYRSEVYVPSAPTSPVRAPRSGHLDLTRGSMSFAFSHQWKGNDGVSHVLFDTGASATRNRLTIEKTAGNVLRVRVVDTNGREKWVGMGVTPSNMPGNLNQPGYSDIAITWDSGTLAFYLDGLSGGLRGGSGTGKLSSAGSVLNIGHDLGGRNGANGSYSYLTIRSQAGTATEVASWSSGSHTLAQP